MPFSDPLADGPVIQRATERALAGGMTLRGTLDVVRTVRRSVETPIVLFTYANPVVRMDAAVFAREAKAAGVDGVLILDYPVEEAEPLRAPLVGAGLDPIFLISPTTSDARIRRSARTRARVPVSDFAAGGDRRSRQRWPRTSAGSSRACGRSRRCRWRLDSASRRPAHVAEACALGRRGGRRQRARAGDCGPWRGAGCCRARWRVCALAEERGVSRIDELRRADRRDRRAARRAPERARRVRARDRSREETRSGSRSTSRRAKRRCSVTSSGSTWGRWTTRR